MKNCLFSIGSFPRRALSTVCAAVSCGATVPVSQMDIFQIDFRQTPDALSSLLEDYSACHHLLFRNDLPSPVLFPGTFTFRSCVAVLPQVRDLTVGDHSSLLYTALRGRNMPLSYRTDPEGVEWGFSALINDHANESCDDLLSYIHAVRKECDEDSSLRIALLVDPADSFSAGAAAVLLPFLRRQFAGNSVSIALFTISETVSPLPDSYYKDLRAFLSMLQERSLLRSADQQDSFGADTMFFSALPASLAKDPESQRLIFLSTARSLAVYFSSGVHHPGLHIKSVDGSLSLLSLGKEAKSFVTFMLSASWLLSDLIPSARSQISRPARIRSIQLNSRSVIFRNILSGGNNVHESFSVLIRALKNLLSETVSIFRSLPGTLGDSDENVTSWHRIADAFGRYITVASEYDVSHAEFEESGLSGIRPVHRDSMADTADEIQQRRIDDMKAQVEAESVILNNHIQSTDPIRVVQAEQDCLHRCREALRAAESKLADQAADTDHLTMALLDRRVRLLKAAVNRCQKDLPGRIPDSYSAHPHQDFPFSGSGLPRPSFIGAIASLIQSTGENEHMLRSVRDMIPEMLEGYTLPDVKELSKNLSSLSKKDNSPDSLPVLFRLVWDICANRINDLDLISSADHMPPVPLLPFPVASDAPDSISGMLSILPGTALFNQTSTADLRGLLAMLILLQYRRRSHGDAAVTAVAVDTSSSFPRNWLTARHSNSVRLFSVKSGDQPDVPFALVIPGISIIPARRTHEHLMMIPSFVTWFDAESGLFHDPCNELSEGNRTLLLSRMTAVLNDWSGPVHSPLFDFLSSFRLALSKERVLQPDPDFKTRVLAVAGLMHLPAYAGSIHRITSYYEHFLSDDPIAASLARMDHFSASDCVGLPDDIVYTWRDIPFARENSRLILEGMNTPEETHALRTLENECRVLSSISDDYRDALTRESALLLERFPNALPDHLSVVQRILDNASQPLSNQSPELVWPWDPQSPSIQTVIRECLGESLSVPAFRPFSDMLTVFPARGNDVIRDTLWGPMCCVMPFVSGVSDPSSVMQADAALPPFSPEWAAAVCRIPEGRMLLTSDFIQLERPDENSCKVTMTLNGSFPLRLVRTYADDEVLRLYSSDIPTIALWPSLPLPPDQWHRYFIYAHIPEAMHISVLSGDEAEPEPMNEPSDLRSVSAFRLFPAAFLFRWNQQTIGALPNLLPPPCIEPAEELSVCIDFGSVGTSVVFADTKGRKPLHGPTMVRTILNNPAASQELIRQEFLPAVPVSALLPTASRIFRNVPGADPVPFTDGIILMSSNLQDLLSTPSDALYTCMKWEEEKGRSGLLCLHQVMLMAALQARMDGAGSLSWRFAIPDEMALEGRESLLRIFCRLAETVLDESGYLIHNADLPISFASESSALGAYFRFCAWEDTRGGFMVTDIGACTVDISLFLRGREQAVRSCQIPLGVHYMLLPSLLKDPEMMMRDFGSYPDPAFHADLEMLTRILSVARTDHIALRKARMSLDHFLADYYILLLDALGQLSASGFVSRFGAILLLHLSYLMMLSGLVLLQIAADPNKNDFLPEQMTLCLSGRGSLLLESLPVPLKTALWRFLTMFRNKRVASMSLLFSAEKKMEIPVGLSMLQQTSAQLPPAAAIPSSLSVRPEELLPEFLLRFARVFPAEAGLLFPGFFTNDYYHPFSQVGEAAVTAAINQSFSASDKPRPYDSLASWIGNLLEIIWPSQ